VTRIAEAVIGAEDRRIAGATVEGTIS